MIAFTVKKYVSPGLLFKRYLFNTFYFKNKIYKLDKITTKYLYFNHNSVDYIIALSSSILK